MPPVAFRQVAEPPLDADEYRRWRAEADRALQGARIQADAGLQNWACFAAEQAAQLAVKGLLHGLGRAPWGHDLVRLGEMLHEAGLAPPERVADATRRLSRHYIPARYPDAHPLGPPGQHYGAADAEDALSDARTLLAFVDDAWEQLHG
jgi:HEPN domain-containing protein